MSKIGVIATLALGALLMPLVAHAAPKDPKAHAALSQLAYATNIVHMKGADYMVLAGGQRVTRPDGTSRTTAYAQHSKCATLRRRHFKIIACATFVRPHKVASGAFEFDPLLESARLRLAERGERTNVRWVGRHIPSPDAWPGADPQYGAGVYADVYRDARARGRISGIAYKPGRLGSFAIFDEGAFADVYRARGVRITRLDNGALRVRARYVLGR
jgi:hypothetical protein